jgi:hypothetical protein
MITLIVVIVLALCALGSIAYGLYGIARLNGDSQAQNGAVVMGVGGMMFICSASTLMVPAALVMAAGALMSMNVIPAAWLGGDDFAGDPPESSVLGWLLMSISLPILAAGSFPFWINIFLLFGGAAIQPIVAFVGLGALMLGGWLFITGFEKSGVYGGHPMLRGGVLAAALLSASWFTVFAGTILAQAALHRIRGTTPAKQSAAPLDGVLSPAKTLSPG